MNRNPARTGVVIVLGCGGLLLIAALIAGLFIVLPIPAFRGEATRVPPTPAPAAIATQEVVPTLPIDNGAPPEEIVSSEALTALYQELNRGVVNIRVYGSPDGPTGQGAGSGFVLDTDGHVVTNNHVVAAANFITVVYFDGFEAEAEIVGTDPDSDLAVLRVEQLPENVQPLRLGDSDEVQVGEQAIAIGNPFGLGSSLTTGVISAVGRTISSGTPFGIPQAIQTDAAINPGNSGGPLLNARGEVIGVNAQIATTGIGVNAGVGFAIPINVVRRVAPVLIQTGTYAWPWLGVRGSDVDLFIGRANELPSQLGAYIHEVIPEGPAAKAGLEGSTGATTLAGFDIPTGGDVVLEVDGDPIRDYNDLLYEISRRTPGQTMALTILRGGDQQELLVELEARRSDL